MFELFRLSIIFGCDCKQRKRRPAQGIHMCRKPLLKKHGRQSTVHVLDKVMYCPAVMRRTTVVCTIYSVTQRALTQILIVAGKSTCTKYPISISVHLTFPKLITSFRTALWTFKYFTRQFGTKGEKYFCPWTWSKWSLVAYNEP